MKPTTDAKTKGFTRYTKLDEALRRYLEVLNLHTLEDEEIPTIGGQDRVLAEDITAEIDIPHFDRSAVDGYAVRAEDTYGASTTNPIVLNLVGTVEIGAVPTVDVGRLEAVRVATGAPMPKGADSVVMQEYVEVDGGRVEVYRPTTPGDNVSKRGEDVQTGTRVLERGTILQPQDLGILAALGKTRVKVVRRPKAVMISTGNELVEPGVQPKLGETVDTNRYTLAAAVRDAGGEPLDLGIARDDLAEIKARISKGLDVADIVLVTGGTSVGSRDLVPVAVNALGQPGVLIHGIAMRPGRPAGLAAVGGKPVVLLPGYPVAALIAFTTLVRPVLNRMLGASIGVARGQVVRVRMSRRVPSSPGMRDFVRVIVRRVDGGYVAEPVRVTGAGVISSMVRANGMVVISEEREGVEEGEEVDVVLLRPLGE